MLTSKQIRWTLDVMPNACKQLFRILNSDTRRMGRFSNVRYRVISVRQCGKYPIYPGVFSWGSPFYIFTRIQTTARVKNSPRGPPLTHFPEGGAPGGLFNSSPNYYAAIKMYLRWQILQPLEVLPYLPSNISLLAAFSNCRVTSYLWGVEKLG